MVGVASELLAVEPDSLEFPGSFAFAVQEPVYGVLKRLGGSSLTICAWLPSSQFSGVSACLPAPVPYAFPLLPCCLKGPFACSFPVDANSDVDLFADLPGGKRVVPTKDLPPPRPTDSTTTSSESPHETLCLLEVGLRSMISLSESGI